MFSDLTKDRIRRFKRVKRAHISLWILGIAFLLSLVSELIVNDKPLYLQYNGKSYFPVLFFYPSDQFGGKYKTEAERDGKGGYGWTGTKFEQRKSFVPWSWGFSDQTEDHPVVNVTWNDAEAFCKWLSDQEGVTYRLPTEAEWEYACRAGTTTMYYHGDDPEGLRFVGNSADQCNKRILGALPQLHNFPYASFDDGYAFTSPVGQFRPNDFGLYDMHGNAWEWCSDWYDSDYYAGSPTDDPTGAVTGSDRVGRGGGFNEYAGRCRSVSRAGSDPSYRVNVLGFRVVRSPSGR